MEHIQANVNGKKNITFLCPYCDRPFSISASNIADNNHELNISCSCSKQFRLSVNFRRFFRKDVILVGEVINLSLNDGAWTVMTVMNLSIGGMCFRMLEPNSMQKGDVLRIRFTLDGPEEVLIDEQVIVRNVRNNEFGCEFINLTNEKKELRSHFFQLSDSCNLMECAE